VQWLLAPVLVAASASALGTQYATPEEAAQRSFPEAVAFESRTVQLSAEAQQAVAKAAGLPARSVAWRMQVALNAARQPLGVVVFDSVVGKFELIDYAVAIGNDGKIRNVEILTYRESHGYEVRLGGWRSQFTGKDAHAPLRTGDDIANISGATLSSTHVTDGIRRIVAVVAALKATNKL
jgi:Na+-translocating ferredoxin:NAD+ oxidoreductase RnfG subunit